MFLHVYLSWYLNMQKYCYSKFIPYGQNNNQSPFKERLCVSFKSSMITLARRGGGRDERCSGKD